MTTHTRHLPPHSAGLASVMASHTTALGRAVTNTPESLLLLAVFAAVVGPVYAATLWWVPHGIGATLAMYLLAAISYVAVVVAGMFLIYAEARRESKTDQTRLAQRWALVRAEVAKTALMGVALLTAMDFLVGLVVGDVAHALPGSTHTDDLVFHATAGAAMMAWVGHIRASVHLPQIMMLCRDQPVGDLRKLLISRAKARYDAPVTFGLLIPMVIALAASQVAPIVSVLAWLHTAWYLHVTVTKAWLASSD